MKLFMGKNFSCGVDYQYHEILFRLEEMGRCEFVSNPKDADVILFASTCSSFQEKISVMIRYMESILQEKKEGAKTIVTGCLARGFLDSKFPFVTEWLRNSIDCVIPYNRTDLLLKELFKEKEESFSSSFGFPCLVDQDAVLYISSGCTHQCTFCKTNYQHTPLVSMDFSRVKEYIDLAEEEGATSLDLRGMNLCQLGLDTEQRYVLPELIDYIETKNHIKHVSLVGFAFSDAIHHDFKYSLKNSKKVDHIVGSFESGDDRILGLMEKGFTIQEFLEFYHFICQDVLKTLNTNLIAGFPTETMVEVERTIQVLKELKPYLSSVSVCLYKDSEFVKAHSLEQLSQDTIEEHAKVYAKFLQKENIPFCII